MMKEWTVPPPLFMTTTLIARVTYYLNRELSHVGGAEMSGVNPVHIQIFFTHCSRADDKNTCMLYPQTMLPGEDDHLKYYEYIS